jgi:hypothetical protein
MMPYYDGTLNKYLINGKEVLMTEEQAERFQENFPYKDVQAVYPDIPDPLPDEAADNYLECSCPPDPPDGNMTATLCPACRLYFESLED